MKVINEYEKMVDEQSFRNKTTSFLSKLQDKYGDSHQVESLFVGLVNILIKKGVISEKDLE